jgi:hypothetical protein
MTDLIYLAIVVVFFAASTALVRACAGIIGTDAPATGRTPEPGAPPAAASTMETVA